VPAPDELLDDGPAERAGSSGYRDVHDRSPSCKSVGSANDETTQPAPM
jgi:hypothetical protein